MPLRSRLAALSTIAALALTACAAVGPDFRAPAAPETGRYAMAGDPASARVRLDARPGSGPWWSALGSPQLDRIIRQALDGNPSLAEADATLQRLQAEAASARGAAEPRADFVGNGEHERINTSSFGFTGFPSPTINLFSIGATVSYDLDLFGGRRRAIEAAEARSERQARIAEAAYLTLTGNVALQAVRIASLRAQIATVEAIIADDDRMLHMVRLAQRAGGAASNASSGGEAQRAQDLALLPPLHRQLSEARHQMALLVGAAPADWTAPDFDLADFTLPATVPVDLPASVVRNRPDIQAAVSELHAASAQIGVATAAQYPNVRLSANLTQSALDPVDLFGYSASGWNLAAGVTGPILNGGALRANRRAAEAEARASMARYQGTVLRAFVQVADALSDLAHDDEAIAAWRRAETVAQGNVDDARTAFRLGGGTALAVVDAQRQLSRARLNLAAAQGQRLSDLVALYTAMGADWRG